MSFIGNIFHIILYQPLLNALVFLYDYIPGKDFGIAIILLTVCIRLLLHPLSAKAFQAQKTMAQLQPKMKAIQEEFKGNKDETQRRLLELYQKEKFNPLSAFVPIFLQFPVLFAIYGVFRGGFGAAQFAQLYPFVHNPIFVNHTFLGIVDLSSKSLVVAVLAGVFQFIQTKQVANLGKDKTAKQPASSAIQSQMMYAFPLFTIFLVSQFPAALGLYWIATSVFSIAQQWYLIKKSS